MGPEGKKRKVSEEEAPVSEEEAPVSVFLSWCKKMGIQLNKKVYVSAQNTVAEYGMLTHEDLPVGEVLFSVPRSALLFPQTSRIRELLEREQGLLNSSSGWVPLLLSLMYEAADRSSPWAPYFGLWPQLSPPDLPMFWPAEERVRLLRGTGVDEAVRLDLENIEREYRSIVLPFIRSHPAVFCPETHTLELYRRLVAFVMAYSFQEPLDEEEEDSGKEVPPPMMVPVADLLNHVAQNNTQLEFTPECLRMVTTRPVPAGAELFNTYGQMGNWQLLHMYGFSEPHPHNTNEVADIQMVTMREAALRGAASQEERAQVQQRWDLLCHMEMVGEKGAFVFGCDEVMTEEELRMCLKVLCMDAEAFAEFKENDGWEEDEGDEEEEQTLTNQQISRFPQAWRSLLHATTQLALSAYATDLAADQALLDNAAAYAQLSPRERHSLQVRYGQKRILHQLLQLTGR